MIPRYMAQPPNTNPGATRFIGGVIVCLILIVCMIVYLAGLYY